MRVIERESPLGRARSSRDNRSKVPLSEQGGDTPGLDSPPVSFSVPEIPIPEKPAPAQGNGSVVFYPPKDKNEHPAAPPDAKKVFVA